jgi:hypothetical protein
MPLDDPRNVHDWETDELGCDPITGASAASCGKYAFKETLPEGE